MNSAITKEIGLLEGCKNTATALLESISDKADPVSDAVSLALVTEKLDEVIGQLSPIKSTVLNLVQRANHEYREFDRAFSDFKRSDRTMSGVMTIQSAATSLTPGLYAAVQAGKQVRRGADAICEVLEEKYS